MNSGGKDLPRQPRIHIFYEGVKYGVENIDIPFVVLVMGDFSGSGSEELGDLREREIAQLNMTNFDRVMEDQGVIVEAEVPDKLTGDGRSSGKRPIRLEIKKMEDLAPPGIIAQDEEMSQLMKRREQLASLARKIDGRTKADQELQKILEITQQKATDREKTDS